MTNEEAIQILSGMKHEKIPKAAISIHRQNEALKMAITALRNHPRWIPCSERLPEEYEADPIQKAQRIKKVSKRLLATIVTKFDKKPHVVEACTKDGNWYVDHVDLINPYLGEVTAWMPIPDPYNGGETE